MKPTRRDDAVVDLLDVVLDEGVVVQADVIITVADVPLVGISLRAAVAGMTTMSQYGLLDDREGRSETGPTPSVGPAEGETQEGRPPTGNDG